MLVKLKLGIISPRIRVKMKKPLSCHHLNKDIPYIFPINSLYNLDWDAMFPPNSPMIQLDEAEVFFTLSQPGCIQDLQATKLKGSCVLREENRMPKHYSPRERFVKGGLYIPYHVLVGG